MDKHSDKRILATGDSDQRKPFSFGANNVDNKANYQIFCINQMFPNQITLKENKRLKSTSDIQRLISLKEDLFDTTKDVIDVFRQHGIKIIDNMKDVTTENNIDVYNLDVTK
jgi:hypothetical protein